MKRITFLFGAGASYSGVPIISDFPSRLEQFQKYLQHEKNAISKTDTFQIPGYDKYTKYDYLQHYIEEIEWLMQEITSQYTIDNLAMNYYWDSSSNGKKALRRLKGLLAGFLIFEQIQREYDKRYEVFISKITKLGIIEMPKNMNLLSWNYDMQFELAFRRITRHESIFSAYEYMPIYVKNGLNKWHIDDLDQFSLVKLNGQAYDYTASNDMARAYFVEDWDIVDGPPLVESLVRGYVKYLSYYPAECGISYAWEQFDDKNDSGIILAAKNATKRTQILVVIGYSFPDYNKRN